MIKYHKLGQECVESRIGLLVKRMDDLDRRRTDGIDDLDSST